jgi:tetratricopeptide (TPR) repeat protein
MATNADQLLDTEELLQLAIRASESNRHEDALTFLKRALEQTPNDGKLHYMLGAEHAQIGLYDRAAEEMAKAVELEPSLHTAHFQLGLLHITSGRVQLAEAAWKALDTLGDTNPLYLFKTGLLHLVRDEFDQCQDFLKRGIALNTFNDALNNDMRRVLNDVAARGAPNTPGEQPVASAPLKQKVSQPAHVLLSAYRENRSDEKD